MVAFIVAFYGVIDPIATTGNVTANNLFVIIFQKIKNKMKIRFRRNVQEFV
jgi:Na+/H+-dicarboxylate symporter